MFVLKRKFPKLREERRPVGETEIDTCAQKAPLLHSDRWRRSGTTKSRQLFSPFLNSVRTTLFGCSLVVVVWPSLSSGDKKIEIEKYITLRWRETTPMRPSGK